ncbi:MAG: hypothetical protein IPO66_18880 [Rhodanobacteraceae bacterium]|nr:hypothetical protein [Rhodanobacteraceae bacterium]
MFAIVQQLAGAQALGQRQHAMMHGVEVAHARAHVGEHAFDAFAQRFQPSGLGLPVDLDVHDRFGALAIVIAESEDVAARIALYAHHRMHDQVRQRAVLAIAS